MFIEFSAKIKKNRIIQERYFFFVVFYFFFDICQIDNIYRCPKVVFFANFPKKFQCALIYGLL